MSSVRRPAVAGLFYPAEPDVLAESIDHLLARQPVAGSRPRALIVPHADYRYSGITAARAYATLLAQRDDVRRVVLLGPSHAIPFRGLALSRAQAFATPLGEVAVDRAALGGIADLPQVRHREDAHREEHSLEMQLPFLQRALDRFSLVPLVVGEADAEEVEDVLQRLAEEDTLILISSDLSHFHSYTVAQSLDRATTGHIESLRPLRSGEACGRSPINGLLALARRRGWRVRTLDLRNSGDASGGHDRVVGYGAYAFH